MSIIKVDQDKCKCDGICAAVCPVGIIRQEDTNSIPVAIKGADKLCINCGHCVAVCPNGALTHVNMSLQDCTPVDKKLLLNPKQAEHFLRARRSIRTYKNKPVDQQSITKLIDIARYAPSGHNFQSVNWMIIYDKNDVNKLAGYVIDWMRSILKKNPEAAKAMHMDMLIDAWDSGVDLICRNAPHLIIGHAPKTDPTAQAACTIAFSYLELAAFSFNIGTCWAGFFNVAANIWPKMKEELNLTKGHTSYAAMMIGHPKYKYHRLPLRNKPNIVWR